MSEARCSAMRVASNPARVRVRHRPAAAKARLARLGLPPTLGRQIRVLVGQPRARLAQTLERLGQPRERMHPARLPRCPPAVSVAQPPERMHQTRPPRRPPLVSVAQSRVRRGQAMRRLGPRPVLLAHAQVLPGLSLSRVLVDQMRVLLGKTRVDASPKRMRLRANLAHASASRAASATQMHSSAG